MRPMHELDSSVAPTRSLPLAALRAFDAAARLSSFRAAADEIALTPSAVSHQIRGLERTLGVALFRRAGRAVELTEAGQAFAAHVRQGFAAFERGAAAVRSGVRARQIRVSSLSLFSQAVLIPNLADFARQWPDYDVRIESTPRFADFDHDDVDVAVRVGDGKWPGLRSTQLIRIVGAPVASAAYRDAHPVSTAADLIGVRLIHDTAQPQAWRLWLAAQGLERAAVSGDLWMDSAPAALQAAEQGLGVAFGIDPLVRSWPGFGERLVMPLPGAEGPRSRYWLVRRPESDRDPKIGAFTAWVRAACRGLAV